MSDRDETPKIELVDLTAFNEVIARLRSNRRPVQDIKVYPLDPFFEKSGSMSRPGDDPFAFGAMGGTDVSAHAYSQELMDFLLTDASRRWSESKCITLITDGEVRPQIQGNHEECLARFLKAHPTYDSRQSEPEGS